MGLWGKTNGHEKKEPHLGPPHICTLGDVNCRVGGESLLPRALQMAVLQRQTGPSGGHALSTRARASPTPTQDLIRGLAVTLSVCAGGQALLGCVGTRD